MPSENNGYVGVKNRVYNESMVINSGEVHPQMVPYDAGYPLKWLNAKIKVIQKLFTIIYVTCLVKIMATLEWKTGFTLNPW